MDRETRQATVCRVTKESDTTAHSTAAAANVQQVAGLREQRRHSWASLMAQLVKNPPAMRETWVRSLGWDNPLEMGMATHSIILAWRIPWTIESMGSQRVGHD